jgi:ribose-phosphate pyrophosphokinase
MSGSLLVSMPGNEALSASLSTQLAAELGALEMRSFPDGETYLRFLTDPASRPVTIVCTLARPNDKVLPLLFAAATARDLGAKTVGLVAPYLAYMRQDRRFKPGEGVTSRQVANLLSEAFDWLVTVDPHLHRYGSLGEIYSIPTRVVQAAPRVSTWIKANVIDPIVIGPDSESEQWVTAVAGAADAPFAVLEKKRRGDREVEIAVPDLRKFSALTPVLVDDIVSSGRTMIEAARGLEAQGFRRPVVAVVHGLFSGSAYSELEEVAAAVVTTNTVPHPSNAIDLAPALVGAISELDGTTRREAPKGRS